MTNSKETVSSDFSKMGPSSDQEQLKVRKEPYPGRYKEYPNLRPIGEDETPVTLFKMPLPGHRARRRSWPKNAFIFGVYSKKLRITDIDNDPSFPEPFRDLLYARARNLIDVTLNSGIQVEDYDINKWAPMIEVEPHIMYFDGFDRLSCWIPTIQDLMSHDWEDYNPPTLH